MNINVDADPRNADWAKRAWDIPATNAAELLAFLESVDMSFKEFQKLPIYQFNVSKLLWLDALSETMRRRDVRSRKWDEDAHPRDETGRFASGDGGSGSGVWEDKATTGEIVSSLQQRFPKATFDASLHDANAEALNSAARGLVAMEQAYGFAPSGLTLSDSLRSSSVYASVDRTTGEIRLSGTWYRGDYPTLAASVEESRKEGWFTEGAKSPDYIVMHEMGHVAFHQMMSDYRSDAGANARDSISQLFDKQPYDDVEFSNYGLKNEGEAWAEAAAWLVSDHDAAMGDSYCATVDDILQTYQEQKAQGKNA